MNFFENFNCGGLKQIVIPLFLAIIALSLANCSHKFYAPNTANVPMFKEKNEVRLNASYSFGEYLEAVEVQSAYSVTPQIGIMASFIMGNSAPPRPEGNYGNGYLAEAGAGYFNEAAKNLVLEAYTGIGVGNVKNVYDDNSSSAIDFYRLFLQPSISYSSNHFELGFSTRFAFMQWHRVSVFSPNFPLGSYQVYENELRRRNFFLAEPAFTIRAGLKNVKLQGQIIGSFSYHDFPHEEIMFSAGIVVLLDASLKKKKKGE